MACAAVTFAGITREHFEKVIDRVHARLASVNVTGDSGEASSFGFDVKWQFVEAQESLTVQCMKKPFFVTEALVNAKIHALVEEQ